MSDKGVKLKKPIKDQIDKWPDEWLYCRAIAHIWKPIQAERQPSWGFLLVIQCQTCLTKREDTIDRLGRVSSRNYIKPDGYDLVGSGDVKPNKSQYRKLFIARMSKGK